MTDLNHDFERAIQDVQRLAARPDNETLLKLYALYKQAAEGDIERAKPGFFDFVGTAKDLAWRELQGVPREEAMRRYVALVSQLTA